MGSRPTLALTRVFGQIEPSEFKWCFRAWTRQVEEKTDGEVVAVDGKTLRGSRDRASGTGLLHLVEAWAAGQELMLGQCRSEGGSNEIKTIPRLLEMLSWRCSRWRAAMPGIDAMGCQTFVAEAIVDAEADLCAPTQR